jgi:predicted HTH transcriptional regulator
MTNEQLAKMFLVTENTVKASLNRLYWRGFIKSEGKKKRVITYIPEEIDKFIQEMNFIGTKFVP